MQSSSSVSCQFSNDSQLQSINIFNLERPNSWQADIKRRGGDADANQGNMIRESGKTQRNERHAIFWTWRTVPRTTKLMDPDGPYLALVAWANRPDSNKGMGFRSLVPWASLSHASTICVRFQHGIVGAWIWGWLDSVSRSLSRFNIMYPNLSKPS